MDEANGTARRAQRAAVAMAVVAAALVGSVLRPSSPDAAAASAKITICHRTHSTGNPYRRITVSQNAVQNARHGGHGLPAGSTNPAVFDASWPYTPNTKHWGDVIPGATNGGSAYNGSSSVALNWTPAGQAHFFGATCGAMSAREFYDVEIAAGVPAAEVIADLNEQAANEDMALLAALGGSFTTGNLASWTTAVVVTTGAPDGITATSATLRGSLTVGPTSTATGFEYGTDPTLATRTTVAASPSPVTGTTAISAVLTGLAPSTTYYVRATGTTNAGTDTEGVLRGDVVAFTTLAAEISTTTSSPTTTMAATTTTMAATTTTSAATTTTMAATTTTMAATTTTSAATTTTTTPATSVVPESSTSTSSTPATSTPATSTTATSTTALPPTTPPATGPAPAGAGSPPVARVSGVVWFDRNGNARIDAREWMLPHVDVVLTPASAPRTQRVELASSLRVRSAPDGSYAFEDVPPGEYVVTAVADIDGFDRTSDTDGDLDWTVRVSAPAATTGIADFAGLGRGHLAGDVVEVGTSRAIAGAQVRCRWGGFDDVLGTPDDVVFTGTADATGRFDLAGVPYGEFSCDATDPATGAVSAAAGAGVFTPERVEARLPVPTARPPAPATGAGGELPRTGSSVVALCVLAAACALAGAAASGLGRRRRRS